MRTPDLATLREPITEDDLFDYSEYLEVSAETTKLFFDRMRFQYQADTWMSQELWEIYCQMKAATERMDRLRVNMKAAGAFPNLPDSPPR